jgi:Cu-Zn family superoxide dismutase
MRRISKFAVALTAVSFLGCSNMSKKSDQKAAEKAEASKMIKADVMGADGVLGEVTLTQESDGVKVAFMVRNLPKDATLASHIHENNVCTPPDFKSAGSHYNPKHVKHGAPDAKIHHLGDLGNFQTDKNGVLKAEKVFKFLSLDPNSENFIGGRALIIHEKKDQFTQPVGNAGGRLGCAVL